MKIGIFGASGFAREVADICIATGYKKIIFIEETKKENNDYGFQLISESEIKNLINEEYVFAVGVGEPILRKKIYGKFPHLTFVNLIHPTASFGYNQLEHLLRSKGNIVCAGVRMTNNISIGNFGIYNLNCTIGHDCIIEDFVTISPGANISGNVFLKEGCYIGTNSAILQGKSVDEKLVIGRYSTVGAGAVVTRNVPDSVVVKGVPAK